VIGNCFAQWIGHRGLRPASSWLHYYYYYMSLLFLWRLYGGLVICELRTGELVICELIVQTTDANLEYNANHKVGTFYAIKSYYNDWKRRKKLTQCTCYKNTTKLHVSVAAETICTMPTYMPNQRINTAQKETHSKILPSPTYMEITKNINIRMSEHNSTVDDSQNSRCFAACWLTLLRNLNKHNTFTLIFYYV